MDIFSAVINQSRVEVASMSVQRVFDSLGFKKSLVSLFSSLFFLTRFTETATKVPKEHAPTVESPNRFFRWKGIRCAVTWWTAIKHFTRKKDPELRRSSIRAKGNMEEKLHLKDHIRRIEVVLHWKLHIERHIPKQGSEQTNIDVESLRPESPQQSKLDPTAKYMGGENSDPGDRWHPVGDKHTSCAMNHRHHRVQEP